MFRPRVIPVLLLRNRDLVKTIAFGKDRYIGDPINAVKIFNDLKADELVFLDILASKEKRCIPLQFVEDVGSEANMPFAVGGGIGSLEQIRAVISAGAEKVILNTQALERPEFVEDAANAFGSSTITVCMDVKKKWMGGNRAWGRGATKASKYQPVEFAELMQARGAGELIVQSVAQDGQMSGYDIELIRQISEAVSIPVVALGGAGNLQHLTQAHVDGCASAIGAGSLFVYHGRKRGVLINYPQRSEIQTLF